MVTRPPILLDFESRSRCDLKKHGGRLYWEHPSTEALCCVLHDVATDTRAVWLPGDPCPVEPGDVLAAHNWRGFDRFAAHRVWGWPLDAEAIDTAELARRAGLPGSLDELGKRWLGRDKDMAASRFTVGLSTCRRPTKKTAHRAPLGEEITPAEWSRLSAARKRELGVLPEVTPEALERVIAYCESDVEIMVHGWPLLEPWLDAGHENEVLRVDGAINDRGIGFDSELARRLLEEDARNARRVLVQVGREIGMPADRVRAIASSPEQFCKFTGAANAQKETVEEIVVNWPRRGDEHGRRAAAIGRARQALASIARGKLEAGLNRVSPDGRLRDTHRYYGAHTGRWSHRGMQLGNMPRPADRFDQWSAEDIDRLAAEVIAGRHADAEEIDLLLRACLVARPGYTFAVRDFSGVEARALAWCADDRKALQVFASGVSPYKVMAGVIFGCDPDEVSKGEARYSVGKIAELACGYGMGAAKFKWTAAKMGSSLDEIGVDAGEVVRAWRQLHAPIVRFWYAIEAAFAAAACGTAGRVDRFDFVPSEGGGPTRDVAIFLPSGRPIVYNDVRISRDARGRPQLSYHGTKSREHTYGGKLTENVIQALCRDLLAAALVKCEDAGLDPVLDVHDEVVCEVPISVAAEGEAMLDEIMHDMPEWAEGFPVGAAGFVGRRYRK